MLIFTSTLFLEKHALQCSPSKAVQLIDISIEAPSPTHQLGASLATEGRN